MSKQRDSQSPRNRERIDSSRIAHAHSGASQPVPLEMRSHLEPLFNHHFGDVRIYSDAAAAATADALHAKAFTVGQDIAFAAGRYDPHTPQGQRLLMHELAHTVQQRHAAPHNASPLEVSQRGDSLERNANAMVSSLGRGSSQTPVASSSSLAIQCEDVNEPGIGYNLDPNNPNVHATLPIPAIYGKAGARLGTSGVNLNLQMPELMAEAGYDWQKGPYAQGQYQFDPLRSMDAQATTDGVTANVKTPEFQLNGGVTNGYTKPFISGQGQVGPVSGGFQYNPIDGFDANARLQLPNGSISGGPSGVTLEQPIGPVNTTLSTDFERIQAEAKLRASLMGQPIDFKAKTGIDVDLENPNFGFGVTVPHPLGIPISPTIGVDVNEDGVTPNFDLNREF